MHIGIVSATYYPCINGVSASTLAFAKEFEQRGHHVSIFCPKYKGSKNEVSDSTKPGISVYRCLAVPLPMHKEHMIPLPFMGFGVNIKKLGLDCIHIQDPTILGIYGVWLAKKLKLPLTQTYHTLWEHYGHYVFLPPFLMIPGVRLLSRILCNLSEVNFVPSNQIWKVLEGYGVTKPIVLCPTGVEFDKARSTVNNKLVEEHLGLPKEKRIILFASRMCKEKSVDAAIKAFPLILKEVPEAFFMISGEGPMKEEVERLIKSLGIGDKTIMKGYQSRPDLYAHYKAADIFLFPSVSETQGLVVLEAQIFGTPVVGVAQNGVAMVMENDRGGFLAKDKDPKELAELCVRMLKDKTLYEKKRKEAEENAWDWRMEKFAGIMEDHLKKGIEKNRLKRKLKVR
jgi:1,2-diacylglycerol 3-alpha-glucosyltransferase